MGPNTWEIVKRRTSSVDMSGTLFQILQGHARGKSLRIKEFKLEAIAPYVYDRFTREWGMFPHHE